MDFCDDAAKAEAKFQQMALANHRAVCLPERSLESQTECLECGDEIPQARREAVKGCVYCTSCQAEKE
ncbi:TraR/DksA C4-type zinc finger protein [Vibrio fluvialis]|nr:TraR/DksA C4-type zinc finger protein [Vibrio fluvialis]MBY8075264.1 TraR/DksA C4-type zinc finger protein [Vibrio fluvialis]MBY8231807.1 TraR/DksA C4-type zinc finger protein [Vibrio fluvialis]